METTECCGLAAIEWNEVSDRDLKEFWICRDCDACREAIAVEIGERVMAGTWGTP